MSKYPCLVRPSVATDASFCDSQRFTQCNPTRTAGSLRRNLTGKCQTCLACCGRPLRLPQSRDKRPLTESSCRSPVVCFLMSTLESGLAVFHPKRSSRFRPNPAAGSGAGVPPKQTFVSHPATPAWGGSPPVHCRATMHESGRFRRDLGRSLVHRPRSTADIRNRAIYSVRAPVALKTARLCAALRPYAGSRAKRAACCAVAPPDLVPIRRSEARSVPEGRRHPHKRGGSSGAPSSAARTGRAARSAHPAGSRPDQTSRTRSPCTA